MQRVYTDEDFNDAADQRKRVARVFWIVLAVYIALAAASLIYYTSLPYKDIVAEDGDVYFHRAFRGVSVPVYGNQIPSDQ